MTEPVQVGAVGAKVLLTGTDQYPQVGAVGAKVLLTGTDQYPQVGSVALKVLVDITVTTKFSTIIGGQRVLLNTRTKVGA